MILIVYFHVDLNLIGEVWCNFRRNVLITGHHLGKRHSSPLPICSIEILFKDFVVYQVLTTSPSAPSTKSKTLITTGRHKDTKTLQLGDTPHLVHQEKRLYCLPSPHTHNICSIKKKVFTIYQDNTQWGTLSLIYQIVFQMISASSFFN